MRETRSINQPASAVRPQAAPRLLLDIYTCLGPGGDALVPLVRTLAAACVPAGLVLCVDGAAWAEAAHDPDIRRRGIDLATFRPITQLPALPLPSSRDLGTRFMPVRSEADLADVRLLGALHSRQVDILVSQEPRIHRLAERAGLAARVLTLAEALRWTDTLQDRDWKLSITEVESGRILDDPALDELLTQECDGYDPYLRTTLAENRGRALLVSIDGRDCGFAVLQPAAGGPQLEIVAIGVQPGRLCATSLESMIAMARSIAQRRDSELHVLLPPHSDFHAQVVEQLGFERRGTDRHGRNRFVDVAHDGNAGSRAHWMLHLEPAAHAALLPEVGGLAQQQLFDGAASAAGVHMLGTRRQTTLPRQAREPLPGDVVFTMHGRADSLAASRALTAVLSVEQVTHCDDAVELMIATARRGTLRSADIPALLSGGGATVLTLRMLGRIEHPVPFGRLKQLGLVRSLPHALRRLEPTAVARIAPSLKLI